MHIAHRQIADVMLCGNCFFLASVNLELLLEVEHIVSKSVSEKMDRT